MKRYLLPAGLFLGLVFTACLAAPGDTKSASADLTCAANERAFNGACRRVCASSAECGAPNHCMMVAPSVSLCMDYSSCTHLGSDSECGPVRFGGYEQTDPYWVPDSDPYGVSYNASGTSSATGCAGNAVWQVAAPAPGDDPQCGEPHPVKRCEKVAGRCVLNAGTTTDVAER